jgi:ABC-type Fe3+ transport system substrate-binding protein
MVRSRAWQENLERKISGDVLKRLRTSKSVIWRDFADPRYAGTLALVDLTKSGECAVKLISADDALSVVVASRPIRSV